MSNRISKGAKIRGLTVCGLSRVCFVLLDTSKFFRSLIFITSGVSTAVSVLSSCTVFMNEFWDEWSDQTEG